MLKTLRLIVDYTKLGLTAAAGVFLLVIILANRGNKTDVWFGAQFEQVPTLWLMAVTAGLSILAFWVLTRIRGVVKAIRAQRAAREQAAKLAQQQALARELAAQERRIDEKLRKSIAESPPDAARPPSTP